MYQPNVDDYSQSAIASVKFKPIYISLNPHRSSTQNVTSIVYFIFSQTRVIVQNLRAFWKLKGYFHQSAHEPSITESDWFLEEIVRYLDKYGINDVLRLHDKYFSPPATHFSPINLSGPRWPQRRNSYLPSMSNYWIRAPLIWQSTTLQRVLKYLLFSVDLRNWWVLNRVISLIGTSDIQYYQSSASEPVCKMGIGKVFGALNLFNHTPSRYHPPPGVELLHVYSQTGSLLRVPFSKYFADCVTLPPVITPVKKWSEEDEDEPPEGMELTEDDIETIRIRKRCRKILDKWLFTFLLKNRLSPKLSCDPGRQYIRKGGIGRSVELEPDAPGILFIVVEGSFRLQMESTSSHSTVIRLHKKKQPSMTVKVRNWLWHIDSINIFDDWPHFFVFGVHFPRFHIIKQQLSILNIRHTTAEPDLGDAVRGRLVLLSAERSISRWVEILKSILIF